MTADTTAHTNDTGRGPQSVTGAPVKARGLVKVFDQGKTRFHALGPVDLDVAAGEFVSVVGASGCGKSTLMQIATGLLSPSAGEVEVAGRPVGNRPVTDIGIAFQDHLLLDFRTARDNVLLQADIRKLDRKKIAARTDELFEGLGLTQAANRYPHQLSGGMRQRVSLVRTLVHDPSLLMMDEPFGALDALTRLQVRTDLERLWMDKRPTVLFITHSVEEAVGLSDRVLVMSPSPGRVVDDITIDLPRPRPIGLTEAPEFGTYVDRIYGHFERLGVLDAHH